MRCKRLNRVLCLLLFSLSMLAHGNIVVIINRDNPLESITQKELSWIYLGKKRTFPNGESAIPVINKAQGLYEKFLLHTTKKSADQFESYWHLNQFTGKGVFPRTVASDQAAMAWVKENKGGISYVQKSSIDPKDNQIKIIYAISEE